MKMTNDNRISLKTIAEQAGLSVSTVSQILNNKPNNFSSEITKHKVRQIAQTVGYRPNFGYKLMRGEKTKTVAIFSAIERVTEEEHIQNLVIALMSEFELDGYACYFSTFSNNGDENLNKVRDLIARGAQHFVILGTPLGYKEIEHEIEYGGQTYIGFNAPEFKLDVMFDVPSAVANIIRFFIAEKRNNFRLLLDANNIQNPNDWSRLQGLLNVFPGLNREELIEKYVVLLDNANSSTPDFPTQAFETGYKTTADLWERESGLQALFYYSDYFALGGIKYLNEKGIRIGKDVLIAGFNNIQAVRNHIFPITSVAHDLKKLSSVILAEVTNRGPLKIVLEPIVHIRE